MLLRESLKNPVLTLRLGMLCLVLGALSLRNLTKLLHVRENIADGITGLLYGLAIGLLILSKWARRGRLKGAE